MSDPTVRDCIRPCILTACRWTDTTGDIYLVTFWVERDVIRWWCRKTIFRVVWKWRSNDVTYRLELVTSRAPHALPTFMIGACCASKKSSLSVHRQFSNVGNEWKPELSHRGIDNLHVWHSRFAHPKRCFPCSKCVLLRSYVHGRHEVIACSPQFDHAALELGNSSTDDFFQHSWQSANKLTRMSSQVAILRWNGSAFQLKEIRHLEIKPTDTVQSLVATFPSEGFIQVRYRSYILASSDKVQSTSIISYLAFHSRIWRLSRQTLITFNRHR